MVYYDENGNEITVRTQLNESIEAMTALLSAMTRERRIEWFRQAQYPASINFTREIDGTVYTVNACFDETASESLQEKAERIILKSLQCPLEYCFKALK